jgi:periplasmic divalent cation tolerance protein
MAPLPEPIVILTTCPDEAAASRIARDLVESGLAACVSRVGPVHSTYRWQGAIQDEPDVPEIIALPVAAGSADYLSWLREAVQ